MHAPIEPPNRCTRGTRFQPAWLHEQNLSTKADHTGRHVIEGQSHIPVYAPIVESQGYPPRLPRPGWIHVVNSEDSKGCFPVPSSFLELADPAS